MSIVRPLRTGWLAIACGLILPGTASADETLLRMDRPAPVSAYGAVVATSLYDTSSDRYRLVLVRGTEVQEAPVAPRRVPFDVDLGPGSQGPVAAYSRCRAEPLQPQPLRFLPDWPSGRGCDLYVLDLRTMREGKLSGASTNQASEFLPSVWRDAVAFGRVYERRSGRRGVLPYLYVRPLSGGRSDRQPGGQRGSGDLENGPTALDLYGVRLSFVWSRYRLPEDMPGDDRALEEDILRLDTTTGGHRVVDRTSGTSVNKSVDFMSVNGDRGRLFYAADCRGDCPGRFNRRFYRYRISTGDRDVARLPAGTTSVPSGRPGTPAGRDTFQARDVYYSTSRDAGVTYAVRGPYDADPTNPPDDGWELVRIENLDFAG